MMMKSFALSIACVRETPDAATVLTTKDAYRAVRDIADLGQEAFIVLILNTKCRIIDRALVSLGILDATLVHPREVFRPAIIAGGSGVIVAHNHPSGDPTPSENDIQRTRQLVDAGKIIGIDVLDHLVIGRGARPFVSLRESGLVDFGGSQ